MKAIFIILLFSFCYNVSVAQVNTSSLVYERAAGAVVLIETGAKFGSGFFVSKDGWIVTNKHVIEKQYGGIENLYNITVTLKSGKELSASKIETISIHGGVDLAFIKTDYYCPNPLPILEYGTPKIQEDVITIGHPHEIYWTSSKGVVSNIFNSGDWSDFIQIDAATNPGNSGGPLLNLKGQVVGVNTSGLTDAQNMNYSIKGSVLGKYLKQKGINFVRGQLVADSELNGPKSTIVQSPTPAPKQTPLDPKKQKEIDDARVAAEKARIKREQQLAEQRADAEKERIARDRKYNNDYYSKDDPYLMIFKVGGALGYYHGSMDVSNKNFDFKNNAPNAFCFLGFRFDTDKKDERGNLIGVFGRYGLLSSNSIIMMYSEQDILFSFNRVEDSKYWELEGGIIFDEWFRLSAGYGNQYKNNKDFDTYEIIDYYTATLGFDFTWSFATFDISSTFAFHDKLNKAAARVNLGVGFAFNFIR